MRSMLGVVIGKRHLSGMRTDPAQTPRDFPGAFCDGS